MYTYQRKYLGNVTPKGVGLYTFHTEILLTSINIYKTN